MRIALPAWGTNISPVLDTAQYIRIYDTREDGAVTVSGEYPLPAEAAKKAWFVAGNADVLICGALSRQMEHELAAHGVTVHPWIMGNIETIAHAYVAGDIQDVAYLMPGCRGRRGCRQRSRDISGHGRGRRGIRRGGRADRPATGMAGAVRRNNTGDKQPEKGE